MLTTKIINKAVQKLKQKAVKPLFVETPAQAALFNEFDKEFLGIESNWKKGDLYFKLAPHPSNSFLFKI